MDHTVAVTAAPVDRRTGGRHVNMGSSAGTLVNPRASQVACAVALSGSEVR
jgi:hypothetical protein